MFKLKAPFKETPAQKEAIEKLVKNLKTEQKHHVLLGVTGCGKSLDFSEPVVIIKDGFPTLEEIGKIIEKELNSSENVSSLKDTIWVRPKRKYQVVSLNPKTLETEIKPISFFIRHSAPRLMYEIETNCGRKIITTADHNFYVLRNGELKLILTSEIKEGDYLPLPQKLNLQISREIKSLNVFSLFEGEKIYIRANEFLSRIIKKFGKSKINELLKNHFSNPQSKIEAILKNRRGSALPYFVFKEILKKLNIKLKEKDLKTIEIVSGKGGGLRGISLKGSLEMSDDFLRLLGYYLAEGNCQNNFFLLSNTKKSVRKEIQKILKKMGWKFSILKNKTKDIKVCGLVYAKLLKKLCGSKAENKTLPYFWLSLSKRQLKVLLQAYFEGDGGLEKGKVTITTKSEKLSSDLAYALMRWGIGARRREILKKASNSQQKLTKYYEISIYSQENLKIFASEIGFRFSQKNKKLKKILKAIPHSNVDVIPEISNLLKETRRALYLFTTQISKKIKLSHSAIVLLEQGKRNPQRKTLKKIIKCFEKRLEEIKRLNLDYLKFYSFLPPKEKIIQEVKNWLEILNWTKKDLIFYSKLNPTTINRYLKVKIDNATSFYLMIEKLIKIAKENNLPVLNPISHFQKYPFSERGKIFKKILKTLNLPEPDIRSYSGMRPETLTKFSYRYWLLITQNLQKAEKNIETLKKLLKLKWTRVKSIKKIPYTKEYVYDFSVEGNETFLAGCGGLFLHNTFLMAKVIEKLQKPALVISPNKTLCAQLYQEFKEFFPENACHFFISYYDYYQPEAYIPETDTYIEKDAKINEEIDRLRHAAVQDVLTRNDVIVCASVSCIYNIGSPEDYQKVSLEIKPGKKIKRKDFLAHLTSLGYQRQDFEFLPSTFRVRGNVIDIFLVTGKEILRVEFFGDEIERILTAIDPLNPQFSIFNQQFSIYPAHFWVTPKERLKIALENIRLELQERVKELKSQNKLVEAQRLEQKTNYDLEMIEETGYCHGIENYSRHLEFRKPGEPPWTLLDYFREDPLIFIDESHLTIPQLRAMANQDRARKKNLIEYGFRLPSCIDNRPLTFEEFNKKVKKIIYVSATPDEYEKKKATKKFIIEQLIRPTGLLEPSVEVRPTKNQVKDLIEEIKKRIKKKQRTLVLTLTKRLAEALADYLKEEGISCQWLHSEVKPLERPQILKELREGRYDVLVGINLLREGLDLPEVALIGILDADKEGFLRSATTLIQIMGRAARHPEGHCILYADTITKSMKEAIKEVERRRRFQIKYNKEHNIVPKPIIKEIREWPFSKKKEVEIELTMIKDLKILEKEMKEAAKNLDFERAARIRDLIKKLKSQN